MFLLVTLYNIHPCTYNLYIIYFGDYKYDVFVYFVYNYIIQDGNTALILASANGHKDIVSLLLSTTNVDVNVQAKVVFIIVIYMIYIYNCYTYDLQILLLYIDVICIIVIYI